MAEHIEIRELRDNDIQTKLFYVNYSRTTIFARLVRMETVLGWVEMGDNKDRQVKTYQQVQPSPEK